MSRFSAQAVGHQDTWHQGRSRQKSAEGGPFETENGEAHIVGKDYEDNFTVKLPLSRINVNHLDRKGMKREHLNISQYLILKSGRI